MRLRSLLIALTLTTVAGLAGCATPEETADDTTEPFADNNTTEDGDILGGDASPGPGGPPGVNDTTGDDNETSDANETDANETSTNETTTP